MAIVNVDIHETHKKTIEIQTPYFYRHDLYPDGGESVIYGKIDIEEGYVTSIHITQHHDATRISMEIELEPYCDGDSSYFSEEYRSDKKEFYKAAKELSAFLSKRLSFDSNQGVTNQGVKTKGSE